MMAIARGSYASRPGSHVAGDVYLTTDSFWDYLVSDGSKWRHLYAGFECIPPDNSAFSWVNQGGASLVTVNGGSFVRAPAVASANLRFRVMSAPAPPYSVTAIMLPALAGAFIAGGCGISLYESSSTNSETISFDYSAGPSFSVYRNATPTTDGSTVAAMATTIMAPSDVFWLRIENDGSTISFWWAADGVNFLRLYQESASAYFSTPPDKLGFVVSARSTAWDVCATLIHWKPVGAVTAMAPRHISDYLSPANLSAVRAIY